MRNRGGQDDHAVVYSGSRGRLSDTVDITRTTSFIMPAQGKVTRAQHGSAKRRAVRDSPKGIRGYRANRPDTGRCQPHAFPSPLGRHPSFRGFPYLLLPGGRAALREVAVVARIGAPRRMRQSWGALHHERPRRLSTLVRLTRSFIEAAKTKTAPSGAVFMFWRRGWDSNPRYRYRYA